MVARSSLGLATLLLLLLPHFCFSLAPTRFDGSNALPIQTGACARTIPGIKIRTRLFCEPKSFGEEAVDSFDRFWKGVKSSVGDDYLVHHPRQAVVGFFTRALFAGKNDEAIAEKAYSLLGHANFDFILYWQLAMYRDTAWVTEIFFPQEHKWYGYTRAIVGAPVGEEIVYRLCLMQCMKFIFQKLLYCKHDNVDSRQKILTPWSILSSVCMAVAHLNVCALLYPDAIDPDQFVSSINLAAQVFSGSLLMLTPIYEKYGILAAVGAHFAWNFSVFTPGVTTVLLFVHLFRRWSNNRKLLWKKHPWRALCESLAKFILLRELHSYLMKVKY
jgi:membrane protease YdiL (CAAX protease family)